MNKTLTSLAVAIFSMFALQACDVSGGYVYGGGSWHHGGGYYGHPHHPYPHHPYPGHHGYPGHYPGHHDGGYHGGYHGGGHHHMMAEGLVEQTPANELAHDFDISLTSAKKIIAAAGETDSSRQEKAMAEIGIRAQDLAPLAKYEMPSNKTIQKIAKYLGEDSSKIEKLFEGFIADLQAEDQS